MIYLEAPAGVGYSYAADGNITTSDDDVSIFEFPDVYFILCSRSKQHILHTYNQQR